MPHLSELSDRPSKPGERSFRGASIEEALAAARAVLGDDVEAVAANRIRRGGVGGFFATDLGVEVIVAIPEDESSEASMLSEPSMSSERSMSSEVEAPERGSGPVGIDRLMAAADRQERHARAEMLGAPDPAPEQASPQSPKLVSAPFVEHLRRHLLESGQLEEVDLLDAAASTSEPAVKHPLRLMSETPADVDSADVTASELLEQSPAEVSQAAPDAVVPEAAVSDCAVFSADASEVGPSEPTPIVPEPALTDDPMVDDSMPSERVALQPDAREAPTTRPPLTRPTQPMAPQPTPETQTPETQSASEAPSAADRGTARRRDPLRRPVDLATGAVGRLVEQLAGVPAAEGGHADRLSRLYVSVTTPDGDVIEVGADLAGVGS